MGVFVCVFMCVHTYICMEAKGHCCVSSPSLSTLFLLTQPLSMNLKLIYWSRPLASEFQGSSSLCPRRWDCRRLLPHLTFSVHADNLKPGSHACMTIPLLTEPSPKSQ